jgi:hypothetical protein
LPTAERVSILDPGFHPVLSFPDGKHCPAQPAEDATKLDFPFSEVSKNIHLEAIMNIPEWQSKMIRSSPKSILKHANKQLELLGAIGDIGVIKNSVKFSFEDEKKSRKGNIDVLTGKRKYTKKLLKLDSGQGNSKSIESPSCASAPHFEFLLEIKERKKHRKLAGNLGMNPHVPRKYTFKKRLRKMNANDAYAHSLQAPNSNVPNGGNGLMSKHFEPITNRSKNSSPIPIGRSEK